MRAVAALIVLASCDPLVPASVAPCAPCPAACADSCLPSGYCPEVRLPFVKAALDRFDESTELRIYVADLPPKARVEVDFDGALDLGSRQGREPWPWWFTWRLDGETILDTARIAGIGFPVPIHASTTRTTGDDGTLQTDFYALRCRSRSPDTCLATPASMITVRVLDVSPWLTCPH